MNINIHSVASVTTETHGHPGFWVRSITVTNMDGVEITIKLFSDAADALVVHDEQELAVAA